MRKASTSKWMLLKTANERSGEAKSDKTGKQLYLIDDRVTSEVANKFVFNVNHSIQSIQLDLKCRQGVSLRILNEG